MAVIFLLSFHAIHESRQQDTIQKAAMQALEGLPGSDVVAEKFQISQYIGPERSFTLKADKLFWRSQRVKPFGFRFALARSMELERAEIIFYKGDVAVANLISDTALLDPKTKNVVFSGKPMLMTGTRRMLKADRISWSKNENRLTARGNCFMGLDKATARAAGIIADPQLDTYTLIDEKI
ncbi:MAG: hypothetical protein PHT59_06510 [Candidatus Omnitrophica bacterium]|nr:hypothetical protein [Candidatus Omnitrophota bacterium]